MIAHVNGKLTRKSAESVVLDVNGVGYEVFIPLSTYYKLPEPGEAVFLYVHTHLREDAICLYGFLTLEEKEMFGLLISVSGIGPRLARNILSGINVADLAASIAEGNKARLSTIPGIGAKSAERLILELKDKMKEILLKAGPVGITATEAKDTKTSDVVSALNNLGYKSSQAEEAVRKAKEHLSPPYDFEELLKEALKLVAKRQGL